MNSGHFLFIALLFCSCAVAQPPYLKGAEGVSGKGKSTYGVSNLFDGDRRTAFCVERADNMWWSMSGKSFGGVGVLNGYSKSTSTYKGNARPRALRISAGGREIEAAIADTPSPQWIAFEAGQSETVLVRVDGVYSGEKYTDTCVSELIPDFRTFQIYSALVLGKGVAAIRLSTVVTPNEMNSEPNAHSALGAISLLASDLSETSLRLLLESIAYADSGTHFNSELNWSLKKLVERYIQKEPRTVGAVLNDERQLGRSAVLEAWDNVIGFSGYQDSEELMRAQGESRELKLLAREIEAFRRAEERKNMGR